MKAALWKVVEPVKTSQLVINVMNQGNTSWTKTRKLAIRKTVLHLLVINACLTTKITVRNACAALTYFKNVALVSVLNTTSKTDTQMNARSVQMDV